MKKNNSGFTIVELLMFMGLITILLGLLTSIFLTAIDVQLSSQATSSVEQDGQYLLTRLTYDIHRAASVVSPALGETADSLALTVDGDTYTYALAGGRLQLTSAAGTHALTNIDTSLSGLQFTRVGSASGKHTLQIQFTVTGTGTSTQPPEVRNYQIGVGLR